MQRQPRKQRSESRLDAAFVLFAAPASAFCVVAFHRGLHWDPLIKPSLFDFTAADALAVTNNDPAVEPYFVFGDEVVGFHGEEDLVSTIRRLLDHPQQAGRIFRAGSYPDAS